MLVHPFIMQKNKRHQNCPPAYCLSEPLLRKDVGGQKTCTGQHNQGFTLIELMVVMLLITIIFAVTVPRLDSSLLQDPRKKTTRTLMNTVSALRSEAIERQTRQILFLDLDNGRIWTADAAMDEEALSAAAKNAFELPGGIQMVELQFAAKKSIGSGTAEILFYPGGFSDQVAINMIHDNVQRFAYKVEPLLPKVKVVEEWVSY
jgi:prepilin-type N-terminal cleavage/methylation domain-containing protein